MATTLGGQYIPAAVDPGQEALAQTQQSVLTTVQANPVSTPAPISDTAAKVGIFSNPTYPEPPTVSTPAASTSDSPYTASVAFQQNNTTPTYYKPTPVEDTPANTGHQGQSTITAGEPGGNLGGQVPDGDTVGPESEQTAAFNSNQLATQDQNALSPAPEIPASTDWRVKLSLAKGSYYLYNDDGNLLAPLKETNGIIFPYTPSISINYAANYDATELTHTNYKFYQYKNSSVGEIQVQADFTAQDTREANYLLAVIHFLRSATKMFYGQDTNPPNGTPPPLLYLSGLGDYQFSDHPVVLSTFSYRLPNDVDYIQAGVFSSGSAPSEKTVPRVEKPSENVFQKAKSFLSSVLRLENSGLKPGAVNNDPKFKTNKIITPTYVPTKISISLTLLPIVSRLDVSTRFSLKDYANGKIYSGRVSGEKGIW